MVLDMGVSPPLLLEVLLFFSSGELLVLPGLVEDPMAAAAAAAWALAAMARLLAAILACSSWCCWCAPMRAKADGFIPGEVCVPASEAAMVGLRWPLAEATPMPAAAAELTALRYDGGRADGFRVMVRPESLTLQPCATGESFPGM